MAADATPAPARRSLPLALMEDLRDLDLDMSLKEAAAVLYVAENDGISLSELRWVIRETPSTASRIVARLSGGLGDRPGLNLLWHSPWEVDSRVRCLHLTPVARELLARAWSRAGRDPRRDGLVLAPP